MDFASDYWGFPLKDSCLTKELRKERARQLGLTPPSDEAGPVTPTAKPLTMAELRAKADNMQPVCKTMGAGSWVSLTTANTPAALTAVGGDLRVDPPLQGDSNAH